MKRLYSGPLCGALILFVLLTAGICRAETSSTSTGVSRLMNPAISVNGLFLAETSADDDSPEANRIYLQEAEMQLTSVVDPFWKADLVIGWHEEESHDDEESHGGQHYVTDIEVATIRSTAMPAGLGLTLGKSYLPFGKHAVLHTHQFPFTRAPIAVSSFLGEHSLNDTGLALDAALPLPWYCELIAYAVDGSAEIFDAGSNDLAYGGRLSNLWDISDNGTLELGGSALTGRDAVADESDAHGRLTQFGVDLTYKWVSGSRSHGPAVTWTNELILPDPERDQGDPLGFYSHLQYRFARQWWLGLGGGLADDTLGHHEHEEGEGGEEEEHELLSWREYKANIAWAPSEFSALRAEVSYLENTTEDMRDLRFSLQWTFTIGSHPAHLY